MASSQIVCLFVLVLSVGATVHVIDRIATSYEPYDEAWEVYKRRYDRTYTGNEEIQRFKAFVKRVKEIEAHNERYKRNQETYTMGINQFTDDQDGNNMLSCHVDEEDEDVRNGTRRGKRALPVLPRCYRYSRRHGPLPRAIDWRARGAVTPVRDQGRCGSCYAFGVTTTIAAQVKKRTGRLIPLSEQQLVDCSKPGGNGCRGSNAAASFNYVRNAGGIVPASVYPYSSNTFRNSQPGRCQFARYQRSIAARVRGCFAARTEEDLKYMVAHVGPVYARVTVIPAFHSYRVAPNVAVNVFSAPNCASTRGHCVTVVGYGSHNGMDYWIIQNSWGTNWGKHGYGFIQRGRNMCGIGNRVSVPILA